MMEQELGRVFLTTPVPDELDAQRRAWTVVRVAYGEREPVRARRRGLRPILALAVLAALAAAALSPAGQAVGDWIRDSVQGEEPPQPALSGLPAPGSLLVAAEEGIWVVRQDGSKRRLGDYGDASWSPTGLYVIATGGHRLVALEAANGEVRWSLSRAATVADARWSGGGLDTRVAYRSGNSLRVVAGDGAPDRLVARRVEPVAPAWKPGSEHVLGYVDAGGGLNIVNVDTGAGTLLTHGLETARALVWSPDGRLLLVVTKGRRHPILNGRGKIVRTIELPKGHVLVDAAFAPRGRALAYTDFDRSRDRGTVILDDGERRRTLQSGEGMFEDVVWSPDAHWLLVGWPVADQWLFLETPGVTKIKAVEDIRREFAPGGEGGGAFPRLAGWCCVP
ncbi:MAG: WD40 repeat domain-containing protein [Gaiellaceae bacterium]